MHGVTSVPDSRLSRRAADQYARGRDRAAEGGRRRTMRRPTTGVRAPRSGTRL